MPVPVAQMSSLPTVDASAAGGWNATFPLTLHFDPVPAGGAPVDAFDVLCVMATDLSVAIGGAGCSECLAAKLVYLNATLSLGKTSVGPVNVMLMQDIIDVVLSLIVEVINDSMPPLPLPTIANMTLTNTALTTGAGYVRFATDFVFTP
jgi:hypothetical protein